jgi:diguanylate cyclase (GGDEF)-like protein/PAS domain S-box-containing protein
MPEPQPPPDPETQRLQTLRDYGVLDTGVDPAVDELTQLAARLFEAPIAFVSLIDRDRQWFKSRVGFDLSETPRSIAFCDHAIRGRDVMVIPDLRTDPRFAANPTVAGTAGIRFYAGAPLIAPSGQALGTLCVLDRVPRDFDAGQRQTLTVLAHQAMAQLELRRQHGLLSETVRALQASETRMSLVLKGADDGFWDWDLVSGERFHSERGWQMLGWGDAPPPCDDRIWERLVHPEDLRTAGRRFNDAIKGRAEHFALELRLRHRDGHDIPVLSRGFIVRDGRGRALRVAGTNTDLREHRRAERERQEVQERFEMLFAHSMDGVLQTLPEGPVLAANPAACAMLGQSEAELIRRGRDGLLDVDDPRLKSFLDERARNGRARGELRMFRADGEPFEVEISSSLYSDRNGQRLSSVMFRDITERRTWARRLEESLDLLDNLSRHVPGVIYQYRLYPDGRSCFPFASEGIREIYEVEPEQVLRDASLVFARLHPEDIAAVSAAIEASAATLEPWRQEYRVVLPVQGERWRRGDAMPERQADGSVLWHGFITDVTERKRIEARTHRLAHFDALTGLPNRRLLIERIEHALGSAQRSGQLGALLFIDLDNFKDINDARGHGVGDVMLQQVARRLEALLRGEDSVARLGGDEFVVLVGNLGADVDTAARSAMAVVEKLRQLLDSPYEIEGHCYSASGSIGITLFPKGGERVDDLLREADTAMYRAKAAGRNRIAFYEAAMQSEVEQRLALEQDLKEALAAGQLQAHVQPQFDAGGREVGGELLLRWHHPTHGHVAPAQFIPVAEDSGLILALGDFVIRQACVALAGMRRPGERLPLSVNVSPRQFHHEGFVDGVRRVLAETGADASRLIFEVTEGLLIDDWEATLARISGLVALGIRFSIDDFGTGYSSLAYLTRLPLYELKIDRSFVGAIPGDANGTAIVEAIVSVARHLKLRVVAEGVETRAQADFLAGLGCDCLQGYLFARPLPLADWLAQRAPA